MSARINPDLDQFEKDLIGIIKTIKYRNKGYVKNGYLSDLKKKIEFLKGTKGIMIHADKTGNLYNISKEDYHKLMRTKLGLP